MTIICTACGNIFDCENIQQEVIERFPSGRVKTILYSGKCTKCGSLCQLNSTASYALEDEEGES